MKLGHFLTSYIKFNLEWIINQIELNLQNLSTDSMQFYKIPGKKSKCQFGLDDGFLATKPKYDKERKNR